MSKTTKIWGAVVVVVIIILVICTGSSNPKTPSESIRVGVIAPLTGPAAVYGEEGRNAVVLALEQINEAGGIKGRNIEYFVEDGKCDAKAALDAWNKLVSIHKVQVVFGGHCSTESLAIAPLSAQSKIPVLAVFATAPKIENEGEWFFRHISTNAYYGVVLANEAYKRGYRKTALITEQKDFPVSYSDAFIAEFKRLGGEVVLDERFLSETKDFRAMTLKLKSLGNDSVFVSTQGPATMALIMKQIKDLGLEKPALFNHAFSYVKFTETTQGYLPKDYLIVQPFTNINTEKGKVFNDAYIAKYGKLYAFNSFFIAADYDMVYRFRDAAAQCIEPSFNIDCVRNQFKSATRYSGVAGDVEISSKYSPFSAITPVATVKIVDGKETLEPIN